MYTSRNDERKPGWMPHFKCVACRTRLSRTASPPDQIGDLCPGCGALFEPVGELAEIVGFQSIKPRDGAERWIDDGGLRAEAVALPPPETSS